MLNKKLLEKQDRKRCVYQSLNYIFATTLDRLSAECVVLGETDMTPDAFAQMLRSALMPNIHFNVDCINNTFLHKGCFYNCDKRQASEVLFASQFDHWLSPEGGEFGAGRIQAFRKSFFDNYFSKLCETTPDPKIAEQIPPYQQYKKLRQYGVLRQIITGELNAGDNVLYLLCPIPHDTKRSYHITARYFTPFFAGLLERRGDNLILVNADSKSADFLLALMETVPCESDEHKHALLCRLATLLARNEKNR